METHRQMNGVWNVQHSDFQNYALKEQMKRMSTMELNNLAQLKDANDEESGMLCLNYF
jgi:hypothetical protein